MDIRDWLIIIGVLGLAYSVFMAIAIYNMWGLLERIANKKK